MLLVVGLGNPGAEYANNRHNIGFMALDEITRRHYFSSYRTKFQGELVDGIIGDERVLGLKPSTFMNESGRSVQAAMDFYNLQPKDLIVIHDEIDLAGGQVRTKRGGGHAGHNGLRSIQSHVGPNFSRIRLGVGHPGDKAKVARYVLKDFAKSERIWLNKVISAVGEYFYMLVEENYPAFMSNVTTTVNASDLEKNST